MSGLKNEIIACMERHGVPLRPAMAVLAVVEGRYGDAADLLPDAGKMVRAPAATEKPAPAAPKAKMKEKASGKGRSGFRGTRTCAQCGETRGVTAFPSGTDVCRRCVKTRGGKLLDPGIKIVRCKHCGRGAPESQINPDGLCGRCTGRGA